ncbi:MAG: 1-deoxy-D-xylulose 5-phosphate reductoisomerase [Malacoplasma sp.]
MKIIICGVTGVVGQLALNVIQNENDLEIVGIVYGKNHLIAEKIILNTPEIKVYSPFDNSFNNVDSFEDMLKITKPDLVINGVSGFEGLNISLQTIENKVSLGLANKESLVAAGWYICDYAKKNNVKIFPIDSEHSAVFDILHNSKKTIRSILITMSGGKYFNASENELDLVTFNDAILHPKWNMGYKISIDSSTFMNKCYEIIEAFYLFDSKDIRVIHHPEAIIHALVEFDDSSLFAHLSQADMQLSIILCLNFFSNKKLEIKTCVKPLSIKNLNLKLNEVDYTSIKPISWGIEFINNKNINKAIGVILVSANDTAIELFKLNKIKYTDIVKIVDISLSAFNSYTIKNIQDIFKLDAEIKKFINSRYL